MTSTPVVVSEAEDLVRTLAEALTRPREHECLVCYVTRQLDEYPCNGTHRHALRYRDMVAPRAIALRSRLSRMGACCCDCELLLNAYVPRPDPMRPDHVRMVDPYDHLPPCAGVRRGSVQACANWVRHYC